MPQELLQTFGDLTQRQDRLPCVSVIMPFEPKMNPSAELKHQLKCVTDQVKAELLSGYEPETAENIIRKMQALLKDLNYNTHKKTIAIFVSPLVAKVYYLDIAVEQKIIIDQSFEIRDLVYSKKQLHKYLLVELSSKWTRIYLGNTHQFVKVISNVPDNIAACRNDVSTAGRNHIDAKKDKQILLDKFLQHTDKGLTLLLEAYHLPVFVMGTDRTIGHFKAITHNSQHIVKYIHGNFEKLDEAALQKVMEPYIADWKTVLQTDLLHQIEQAADQNKLSTGMQQVWKSATEHRGKLLITSKNFIYPAVQGTKKENIFPYNEKMQQAFYIKDAVDDVIEKVLADGGDAEFVDEELLDGYGNIVLIESYPHFRKQ